jgi:hypothetical protein
VSQKPSRDFSIDRKVSDENVVMSGARYLNPPFRLGKRIEQPPARGERNRVIGGAVSEEGGEFQ